MKVNSVNNTNFGAKIIAQSGNFKICKLNCHDDIRFLNDFCKRTDFQQLMPQLSKKEADRWHEMLCYAVGCAKIPYNTTYLEILNNKICGIVSCCQNPTTVLDCICTIPVKAGEKVKLAGKTLFYQIFKDFAEYGGSKMKLKAITDGPYNTINKYKELGFKETSTVTKSYVVMNANKYAVNNALSELKKFIPYKTLPEEKIDLKENIIN